jgi:predicted phosphodiesterase
LVKRLVLILDLRQFLSRPEILRIQYFSDLHLEFGDFEFVDAGADLIVAAGDIGLGLQGLEWLARIGQPAVYVAGNHEYYGGEYFSRLKELREAARGTQVRFLERDTCVFGKVRFLGCTLWTELGGEENERLEDLLNSVSDFRKIKVNGKPLDFAAYAALHQLSRQWLWDKLAQPFDGQTVVVTHHAPTPWSWRENPSHVRRYAYCNNLKEFFHQYDICAWFHGHTHAFSDYLCSGARILCNPRGYHPHQLVNEFDPCRAVEI